MIDPSSQQQQQQQRQQQQQPEIQEFTAEQRAQKLEIELNVLQQRCRRAEVDRDIAGERIELLLDKLDQSELDRKDVFQNIARDSLSKNEEVVDLRRKVRQLERTAEEDRHRLHEAESRLRVEIETKDAEIQSLQRSLEELKDSDLLKQRYEEQIQQLRKHMEEEADAHRQAVRSLEAEIRSQKKKYMADQEAALKDLEARLQLSFKDAEARDFLELRKDNERLRKEHLTMRNQCNEWADSNHQLRKQTEESKRLAGVLSSTEKELLEKLKEKTAHAKQLSKRLKQLEHLSDADLVDRVVLEQITEQRDIAHQLQGQVYAMQSENQRLLERVHLAEDQGRQELSARQKLLQMQGDATRILLQAMTDFYQKFGFESSSSASFTLPGRQGSPAKRVHPRQVHVDDLTNEEREALVRFAVARLQAYQQQPLPPPPPPPLQQQQQQHQQLPTPAAAGSAMLSANLLQHQAYSTQRSRSPANFDTVLSSGLRTGLSPPSSLLSTVSPDSLGVGKVRSEVLPSIHGRSSDVSQEFMGSLPGRGASHKKTSSGALLLAADGKREMR